jgi:hypothetical protein
MERFRPSHGARISRLDDTGGAFRHIPALMVGAVERTDEKWDEIARKGSAPVGEQFPDVGCPSNGGCGSWVSPERLRLDDRDQEHEHDQEQDDPR